jgi:hypothetical protein
MQTPMKYLESNTSKTWTEAKKEGFFKSEFNLRKGEVLSAQEIRQYIMNYIKEGNLQSQENKKYKKSR